MLALSVTAFTAPGFADELSRGSRPESGGGGSRGESRPESRGGGSRRESRPGTRPESRRESRPESRRESSSHGHERSGHEHQARHERNEQRSREHRDARGHYHHGRFDDHYYHSHFGRGHPIIWGGPGFWYGAAWASPFWFGGVYWGFGAGFVFLPEWQVPGWYISSIPSGYVLLNPGFPTVQVPVVVNVNMAPPVEQDQGDEGDQ